MRLESTVERNALPWPRQLIVAMVLMTTITGFTKSIELYILAF